MFDKLNKYLVYAIYAFLIVSCINGCRSCNTSKDINGIEREMDSLKVDMQGLKDGVETQFYTKEQIDVVIAIEGYEISKRMLYDNNSIVRNVMRPDDRIIEYDQKIKVLREKLK